MKKLTVTILLVSVGMNLHADEWYDKSTGFTWYYTISGDAATLTGCSPKDGKLPPLPSYLGGKLVTKIGRSAFQGCRMLTGSLKIGAGVQEIEPYAFIQCHGLTGGLTIPDTVTRIGSDAFRNCTGFSGPLVIGKNVAYIDSYAFYDCGGFTGSLTIPESIITIGKWAFLKCDGIIDGVIAEGGPTAGFKDSGLWGKKISYSERYIKEWAALLKGFDMYNAGPFQFSLPKITIITSK